MVQSNLLLWGFHSKIFSLWNESTGELIFEHNCGGANRIWDFYLPDETQHRPSKGVILMNGEVMDLSRKFQDVHAVTRSAWLMYTSKSEVYLHSIISLTKVAFP